MNVLSKLSSTQKYALIAVCVAIAAFSLIGYAVAVYGIRSPDSTAGTVNPTPPPATPTPTPVPQATLSQVTISPSTVTWGATWTLTTTLSDALAGVNVDFYDQNGNLMGSAPTDASGTASISFVPPVGNWIYHANTLHP